MKSIPLVLYFLLLLIDKLQAQPCVIKGFVTSEDGKPIPFAGVYLENSTQGTLTNTDGLFTLEITSASTYNLIVKMMGYKTHKQTIATDENCPSEVLRIMLKEDKYDLSEIVVQNKRIDPAYAIIKACQQKRNFFLKQQVKEYTCSAYVKSLVRVGKFEVNNKLLGFKLFDLPALPQNKIIYLSEALSEISFANHSYTERMLYSKVSGQAKSFSFGTAHAMLGEVNFYQNQLPLADIYERPIFSPIADQALSHYTYRLIETYRENSYDIHHIEVKPKIKNSACFYGYIRIVDQLWNIHSVQLYLDKSSGIDYLDTLEVRQVYTPIQDSIWIPFQHVYRIKLSANVQIAKGDASGYIIAQFSNYNLKNNKPLSPPTKNTRLRQITSKITRKKPPILQISSSSIAPDSSLWPQLRPIPLTREESDDYRIKDSLETILQSRKYLDSVDRKENIPKGWEIITGFTFNNRSRKFQFHWKPLYHNVLYNTVEGWVVQPIFRFTKNYDEQKYLEITPYARYGFASDTWYGKLISDFRYKPLQNAHIKTQVGKYVFDFNESEAITPLVNTLYTLFAGNNYQKLYEKTFANLSHTFEPLHGLQWSTRVEYAQRTALDNRTDFKFISDGSTFTPNNPAHLFHSEFVNNRSFWFEVQARCIFKQDYVILPYQKITFDTKFPVWTITFRKAIPQIFQSQADFDFLMTQLQHDFNLKQWGRAFCEVQAGGFLNTRFITFADYKHFNGNQTIFLRTQLKQTFLLLDYYAFSTSKFYTMAHWEHHWNGAITQNLPIIKKLKWQLITTAHYIFTPELLNYAEYSVGMEHVFKYIRIEYAGGVGQKIGFRQGIRLGLGF